jgi:multidrug transporter EmrE-like cation transporter
VIAPDTISREKEAGVKNSLVLIFLAVVLGVGGQLTLKLGMSQVGRIGSEALERPLQMGFRVLTNPLVVIGLGLYVLGAVVWLTVLSRVPLSFAYPILASSYAFTPVLAWLLLGESVPSLRWIGIATICLGVFLVSRT